MSTANPVNQPMSAHSPVTSVKTGRRLFSKVMKNRALYFGGALVLIIVLVAVFAPLIVPFNPNHIDYGALLQGSNGQHWFGSDDLGRDELSRVIIGARTSMEVSVGAILIGVVIGVPVGLLSGFYRGFWDDWVIMRIVDALQAFPFLVLALVLAAVLGPGAGNAMIAIGIGYLPIFVRVIRGQVLVEIEKEYVAAARIVGAGNWRIMWRHIFPNITSPLIVQMSIAMGSGIVAEASLSYLGLGAQPPTASWGTMLHTAQGYMNIAPGLAIFPGIAIVIAVFGFNLLGDGLRDKLDPKSRS